MPETDSQTAAQEAREQQAKEKAQEKPKPASKPAAKRAKPRAEKKDTKPAEKKDEKKNGKVEMDPDLALAHRATCLATGCDMENGRPNRKTDKVPFGASVNSSQVKAVKEAVKGKDITKLLGVSESQLKAYAQDVSAAKEWPEEGRKNMREFNKQFPQKMKMWARKDAAILYELLQERKRNARKSKSTKQPTPAAA